MLKSNNAYIRSRKTIAGLVFGFIAAISAIAALATFSVSMGKLSQAENIVTKEFAQTQEYQDALESDYNFIVDNAILDDRQDVINDLNHLDTINYKKEKLLSSKSAAMIEKYNKHKNSSRNLDIATGGLIGTAALTGGAAALLLKKDKRKEKQETEAE